MLIRSQNKKTLTNFDKIYIVPSFDDFFKKENPKRDLIAVVGNCTSFIGTYSTEEKAVKVLDMIQEEYLKTTEILLSRDTAGRCLPKAVVFEMPQDDEVKV